MPTTQVEKGKAETGLLNNSPVTVADTAKDVLPTSSHKNVLTAQTSSSTSSPSLLAEIDAIPDRPEKRRQSTRFSSPGH